MCGIYGKYGKGELSEEELSHIKRLLNQRGPDSSACAVIGDSNLFFHHTRLAIEGAGSKGAQPKWSEDKSICIIFNGEVYNHLELKERYLRQANLSAKFWSSSSDTDTLVELIALVGIERALRLCDGMFAIAIYMEVNGSVFLARDQWGQKPMYWTDNRRGSKWQFEFGSDWRCFSNRKYRKCSELGLAEYSRFGFIPEGFSAIEGVERVRPGCLLEIRPEEEGNERFIEERSWLGNEHERARYEIEKDAGLVIAKSVIAKSVADCVQSDSPVSMFLSGGIDSALIAALSKENGYVPEDFYTLSFRGDECERYYDETERVERLCSKLGIETNHVNITEDDVIQLVQELDSVFPDPFGDSSALAVMCLAKRARQDGYKVAITGDGGDEMFNGYNRHVLLPRLLTIVGRDGAFRRRLTSILASYLPLDLLPIGRNNPKLRQRIRRLVNALSDGASDLQFYLELCSVMHSGCNLPSRAFEDLGRAVVKHTLRSAEGVARLDSQFYLPGDIMVKSDYSSMAYGVEIRSPLLSRRIYASGVSWAGKNIYNERKGLLKAVAVEYLGKSYVNEKKSGFSVPLAAWFRGCLSDWLRMCIHSERLAATGIYNMNIVHRMLDAHMLGKDDYSQELWSVAQLSRWLERERVF